MNKESTNNTSMSIARVVADEHDTLDIERCMQLALDNQSNPCYAGTSTEEDMNILAKASFIRAKVDAGMTVANALRELGRRMRAAQMTD